MVISKTPLRMSFTGGGSDLAGFYRRFGGAVVSSTFSKYIYITVNRRFSPDIRASYSVTEYARSPSGIKHELIRESLKLAGINKQIEITSIGDVPSKGTGLGSSSAYTVGLLNALTAYKGQYSSKESLAQNACRIEIDILKKPIGKQDQYATAFGGLNLIEFGKDDTVQINPIICAPKIRQSLEESLLLLYTGITRSAASVLDRQKESTENGLKDDILKEMSQLSYELAASLRQGRLSKFGEVLDRGWQLKKKMSETVSTPRIDHWYQKAIRAGARGGKILGAGGGGFLLLYAPRSKHAAIRANLPELANLPFSFDREGSKIIYYA